MSIYKVIFMPMLFVMLILSAGCGNNSADTESNTPVNIQVEKVANMDAGQVVAYSGTIEESETIPLAFAVAGSVSRVFVSEGASVKKGQLLATLDNANYKNAYEIELASQKQAEDAYKRLLPMYKNGNLPEIKIIERESDLQRIKSSAAIAKKNLYDCNLYSRENGVVSKRLIDPGMSASPAAVSIEVVKIEKVFARVPIPENEIVSIKKGQKAIIKIGALDNAGFSGTVEEIGVSADPLAHTYKIKIGIINKNWQLKPGMICSVSIDNMKKTQGVVIPGGAVMVDEKGKNYVFALDAARKKSVKKYVTPGRLLNNGIEILNGLSLDDVVVINGQHKLVDGASVNIINN
jgi:membrane fusion protein, multidrug efflux system